MITLCKIILIILIIRIIILEFVHGGFIFWEHGTEIGVKEIMEDPYKYVRYTHLEKLINNLIWLEFLIIFYIHIHYFVENIIIK